MVSKWSVNGRRSRLDPADRGLAYGDGLFETMAAVEGSIPWIDRHLARLTEGCRRLAIPLTDLETVRRHVTALTPREGRAVVKLIVTRGSGTRGYRPPPIPRPTVIVGASAWRPPPDSHYTHGIALVTCDIRLGENSKLAGLKHLCRLEQVMAQIELVDREDADEGLLLSLDNRVVSGTSNNIFAVRRQRVQTPRVDRCGVRGVMRGLVLDACRTLGLAAEETNMNIETLLEADEVFVTNALAGIRPVRRLDSTTFPIGPQTNLLSEHISRIGHD